MRTRAPIAAAALLAAVAVAAPLSPAGNVTSWQGRRPAMPAGAEKLAVGSPVYQGDALETQRRTRLESAAFGRTAGERKVSAKLVVGKIWANVAKAVGGEGRFEVQTGNAVAGVRGTTFLVDAATDRSVVVKVYSGTVAVAAGPIPRPAHGESEKPERREVAGPREVTREQWERIVTSMMAVRVSAEGVPWEPEAFALAQAGKDQWEEWNRNRDGRR